MLLAFALIVSTSAVAITSVTENNKTKAFLDPILEKMLQNTHSDERIPVDVWLYETETIEEREGELETKIGINKFQIFSTEKSTITTEKVDEYIEMERAIYAKNRNKQYELFLKDYSKMDGLRQTREEKRLFFSQYAPLISTEMTPTEIKTLAKDNRVHSIYYSPKCIAEEESDISSHVTATNYTSNTLGYTGNGIKIGMIEAKSLPEISDDYFTSSNIILDQNVLPSLDEGKHATRVAAIMVGKSFERDGITYRGIVPDATLYATYATTDAVFRNKVEWLLSQGVHVINISLGFGNTGVYDALARWIDHIAINHSVHIVKSAGNVHYDINDNPIYYISSPGMAYNSITVGSINDNNTYRHDDDVIASNSCSLEITGNGTNKPDLVAPGANIYTAVPIDYASGLTAEQQTSGTSFAAPQVTAIVAQLCQYRPALRTLQDAMKAILTASISHEDFSFDSSDVAHINYDTYGAGVVNSKDAFYTAGNGRYLTADFPANTAANAERRYTLYVSPSDNKIRVSLAWLKYSTLSGTHANVSNPTDYTIADLDLYILDPNGNYIDLAISDHNNVEIIDFEPNGAGNYTIVVSHCEGSPRATYYALAWW